MRRILAAAITGVLFAPAAVAQAPRADSALIASLRWRSIGPANMGGRVSDIEGNPLNAREIFVALATGGVWKTVNAGTTWTPVFDDTGVHSVSDLAIAPSDTSIVWAGTGEEDSRNSISPGGGVFKSTDGGRTWTYMGLRETQHIGRIVIHPRDPDIVWIAALGHAWGPNRERGIYKTTDGGRSWRLVNGVSDRAGFVDLAISPDNPDILLATSWERRRGPWYLRSGGPGSALWRSTNGGERWTRISGSARSGLPTTTLGRIGVAFAPSNGRVAYALVEADSNPNAASLRRGFVPDTSARQTLQSGLFRSDDGGVTWARMNDDNNRPFYYSQLRVDPRNPDRVYWLSTRAQFSNDSGRTWRRIGAGIHVDYHAMWIDPGDPEHYYLGEDGGIAQTFDRGRTYDAILQIPVGQFYAIGVDMQRPFWVCGGLQDNGTWCGPSEAPRGAITNADWVNVGGGDGFYAAIDPNDADIVYSESQGGAIGRINLRSWQSQSIRPGGGRFGAARQLEDSILIARGDTTVPATPAVQRIVDSLNQRITLDTAVLTRNRFNWSAPFFISPHNATTLYMGGQRLWKSLNRGDDWVPISEDLSTRDTARIRMSMALTGGITSDATGAETHGTITTVAESPVRPGILWVGTDDGNVWLSRNDGTTWENLTGRFAGVPSRTWVSRVEASPFDSATVYVTFDGHRDDNFRPYVFVSGDFGRTFRSIVANLPGDEYVHVIRADPRRRGLLFLGTERAAYVSTAAGAGWQRLMGGMPTVPVHDLVVHPRDRVLVAGTHGRSIYTMDIGPLEEATDSALAQPATLFAVEPALLYRRRSGGGGVGSVGSKVFSTPNGPFGARIAFRVAGSPEPGDSALIATVFGDGGGFGGSGGGPAAGAAGADGSEGPAGRRARAPRDTLEFVITDAAGDTVRTLRTSGNPTALRWLVWDLRRTRGPLGPSALRDSAIAARRQEQVRDSMQAAARAGGPGRRGAARDPQPDEPGTWVNPAGGRFGGGGRGFRGGAGAYVDPGTYLVTVRIGSLELKRTIRVEQPLNTSGLSGGWE